MYAGQKPQPVIGDVAQAEVIDRPRGPCHYEFAGRWFPSKQRAVITYEHFQKTLEGVVEFDTLPINNFDRKC